MLIGNKVILRPLKIEDLPKVNQWRNDLELIKLTQGIRFPKTKEMDEEWFNDVLRDKSNRNIYFGIDEKESGEFIGMISLNNIDYISGTANRGCMIGDDNKRSLGYGGESIYLINKYAFNILNLRKIITYIVDYNIISIRVNKRINYYREEGILKNHYYMDGEYHDVLILSIFREDFLNYEMKE